MPEPGGDTLAALTVARQIAAELERSELALIELALIEAARDAGATWTRIAAAMGARNRQTAQKRHADLARRHPRPQTVDTPAPQIPDAGHDHDIPEEKALVNRDALPKKHGPAAVCGRGTRRTPETPGYPEDHRRHHRRGPLSARPGTGPRRDARLARPGRRPTRGTGPPDLARGAQPTRLGAR
jgi:hypothetical protein